VAFTENVTILFTDIEDSTAAASALSPEAGDELRRIHFAALRRAIQSTGGYEVKNLGDGLMVVFTTASDALSCSVTMQQLVALIHRQEGPQLRLRIGISGGEVTREGDDYFGDPVVEAARLCALADAGQILAAEFLRSVAGRRSAHRIRPVGLLELKGLPQPTATGEVLWEPLPEDQTVWAASVVVDGEAFPVSPGRQLVFGRASAPGVLGLDGDDMGISATAGSIEWEWGVWWIVNRSRKRPLLLDTGSGSPHRLDCGQRFAITAPRITVLVAGAIFTHRLDVTVPDADLNRDQELTGSGTLPVDNLQLTERDKQVLTALFSGYLEDFPRRWARPLSYRQAAELLGAPWSPVTVRKQVERVKERAKRLGLYFDGAHANHDLADYLIGNSLLVPSDLQRLNSNGDGAFPNSVK
jgi:class 3 adenylate cyclase